MEQMIAENTEKILKSEKYSIVKNERNFQKKKKTAVKTACIPILTVQHNLF